MDSLGTYNHSTIKQSLTLHCFPPFLKPFTCVSMRTSSQRWRSTPCSPFALQPTGPLAHARRLSSSWSPWIVWTLNSGSFTRIWPWKSSPSTAQRTAAWWIWTYHQRGEGITESRSTHIILKCLKEMFGGPFTGFSSYTDL